MIKLADYIAQLMARNSEKSCVDMLTIGHNKNKKVATQNPGKKYHYKSGRLILVCELELQLLRNIESAILTLFLLDPLTRLSLMEGRELE